MPNDSDLIVHIAMNMAGLANQYLKLKINRGIADFVAFVRGFNMMDALFQIVDAGQEKACADFKIKGQTTFCASQILWLTETGILEREMQNLHCYGGKLRHIFLGALSDGD